MVVVLNQLKNYLFLNIKMLELIQKVIESDTTLSEFIRYNYDNFMRKQSVFGQEFNQKLNNSLDNLSNLTHLKFGNNFDQLLNYSLDKLTKLTHLTFGNSFKRPLNISSLILQNLKLLIILNRKNLYKIHDFRKKYNLSDDCQIKLIKDIDDLDDFDDINDV